MNRNLLDKLKNGDTDFLSLSSYLNRKYLATEIRKSNDRDEIIKGFLSKVKDTYPNFCFNVIYDMDEYKDDILYILENKDIKRELTGNILREILTKDYGKKYVINNLDKVIEVDAHNEDIIFKCIFADFDNNLEFIKKMAFHNSLRIRYITMSNLVCDGMDKLNLVYDDILNYVVRYDEDKNKTELMEQNDLCNLAITAFNTDNKELYLKLKQFIFNNYKYNDLAEIILMNSYSNNNYLKEFEEAAQADELFLTSRRHQYIIYKKYREYISDEIINNFSRYLNIFKHHGDYDSKLSTMFKYELWRELVGNVDKYLSLSKDTSCRYVTSGTCSSCYRVGDFVFKLSNIKYNKDDIICPNNYLIHKNLEEHFVRDYDGQVLAATEIQKYLSWDARGIPDDIFIEYRKALLELGYVYEDHFLSDKYGDNCMLLDSYRDADCSNPESLPDWFKKYPLVLIDRDLVCKKKIIK